MAMATKSIKSAATPIPYSISASGINLKFIPKKPVIKLNGRKIVEIIVNTFIT